MNSKIKPRVAASNYLNTAPLIWSFKHGARKDQVTLVEALPSSCAELLARNEVDFALAPAIEYQRIQDASLVPGVCVGSRQRVRSVVLVSRLNNLRKVRTRWHSMHSSRTSAALVKIIFKEFLRFEPDWTTRSPDLKRMLHDNDAALIIGDPAMRFARDGLRVWDLAALWHDFTGLGFVFAMWMAGKRGATPELDFLQVAREGLARRNEIIDSYEQNLGLSRSELETYLTENITFFLDGDLRKGLDLYYELARKHGLIPGLKPLNL